MSLVVLCSVKGSPGVTTTSLALSTSEALGSNAILLEADPSGGDLASRLGVAPEPGLASLAAEGRRELDGGLVEKHCQHVAGIDIVLAPVGASATRSALQVLRPLLATALRMTGDRVVVCDIGRLDAGSPCLGLAEAADLVLIVTRPILSDLAHLAEQQGEWSGHGLSMALVLSGEPGALRKERYPAPEVSDVLGLEVLGSLAWDTKGVAALFGLKTEAKRSALVESSRALADKVAHRLGRPEETPAEGGHPVTSTTLPARPAARAAVGAEP
ncbi:MAG: chromosome partitioning protein [Acidimicrobiales bacterium]